jgi:hypothetical protein
MNTLNHSEAGKLVKVSHATIINWIKASKEGHNSLQIAVNKLVNNAHNMAELQRLADNSSARIKASSNTINNVAGPELFKVFSPRQIAEMYSNIESKKQIPLKLTYLGEGAKYWDRYVENGVKTGNYNTSRQVSKLLNNTADYLIRKIGQKQVNIIEIGPGNCDPIREFLGNLVGRGLVAKYVAADISPEMNKIATDKIQSWYPELSTESIICDIESDDLVDVLYNLKSPNTINLVLFTGSTIGSMDDEEYVLKNLERTLGKNDLLMLSNKIVQEIAKTQTGHIQENLEQLFWIPKLLGLELNQEHLETKYDSSDQMRKVVYVFPENNELTIGSNKITFYRGDELTLWQHRMTNPALLYTLLEKLKLRVVQMTAEVDNSHVLFLAERVV